MIKTLTALMILATSWASCSKKSDDVSRSQVSSKIIGTWSVYDYSLDGVADPSVIAQKPVYEFRADGKVYFSQIGPVYRDTLQYQMVDQSNIKLTKPWVNATASSSLTVDKLNETSFDFTSISGSNKVGRYKTQKQ